MTKQENITEKQKMELVKSRFENINEDDLMDGNVFWEQLNKEDITTAQEIIEANKITNKEELKIALKRMDEIWDKDISNAKELNKLADLILEYEKDIM